MDSQKKPTKFSSFFDDILDELPESTADPAELEVTKYLSSESFQYDASTHNILEAWKKDVTQFPVLSKMALYYLSAPATSVPSERVFSDAGFIVNQKRSNLDPKMIDKLIFLHHNSDF